MAMRASLEGTVGILTTFLSCFFWGGWGGWPCGLFAVDPLTPEKLLNDSRLANEAARYKLIGQLCDSVTRGVRLHGYRRGLGVYRVCVWLNCESSLP